MYFHGDNREIKILHLFWPLCNSSRTSSCLTQPFDSYSVHPGQLEEQRHWLQVFLPTSDFFHDWAFPRALDGNSVSRFRGEPFEKLGVLHLGASSYINLCFKHLAPNSHVVVTMKSKISRSLMQTAVPLRRKAEYTGRKPEQLPRGR